MTTSNRRSRMGIVMLVTLSSFLLASCGSGGHRRGDDGSVIPTARELDPASTHYSDTMDMANAGNCNEDVISVLTCYAYRGHGYEGAQTALGQCLIKTKKTENGLVWLKRAANAGWPDAQKALAQTYLAGNGVQEDNIQAGKWGFLYMKNPSLLSLGVQPDKEIVKKLSNSLSQSEILVAQSQASNWIAQYWQPQTALDSRTAATCYVAPRRIIQQGVLETGPDSADY